MSTAEQIDRIPPNNLEAEMAVLGAIMVEGDLFDSVAAHVTASDFYAHVHEAIFATLAELHDEGQPLDKITVATRLKERNRLENVGGVSYLSSLMDTVQTASSAAYYAKIVAEKAKLRGLIQAAARIEKIGYEGEADADEAMQQAESALRAVTDAGVAQANAKWLGAAASEVWNTFGSDADKRVQPTPWRNLNRMLGGGFRPQTLNAWVAAPKQGKTAAINMLSLYTGEKAGPVAHFALEMGRVATIKRLLALISGVTTARQNAADVTDSEMERLHDAYRYLYEIPIKFFDRFPQLSISDIRRECRRIKAEQGALAAVVIDHINFTKDATAFGSKLSKHERLDAAYMRLLEIGSELDCVMHVVQHTNRAGMDGPPSLSNIRDGGNIEGHAHTVIFPFRPDPINAPHEGEFIVAANRDGDAGIVPMHFLGANLQWLERDQTEPWFKSSAWA